MPTGGSFNTRCVPAKAAVYKGFRNGQSAQSRQNGRVNIVVADLP